MSKLDALREVQFWILREVFQGVLKVTRIRERSPQSVELPPIPERPFNSVAIGGDSIRFERVEALVMNFSVLLLGFLAVTTVAQAGAAPHYLHHGGSLNADLGCYGSRLSETPPNIDRLAGGESGSIAPTASTPSATRRGPRS